MKPLRMRQTLNLPKRGKAGIKAVAKACGLHFDRGRLGRILVSKFLQQVQYIEKKMAKATAQGTQLHFKCRSKLPPVLSGNSGLAAAHQEHPLMTPALELVTTVGYQMHPTQQPDHTRLMQIINNANCEDLSQQFAKQLHLQH
ncbi:hypothetical protein FCOIX_9500 [Fusarium coicis]|nr:hypothetical protein FCOIX_9500 [Fusarium coicis]